MNSIDQHGWTRKPLGEVANVVSGYAFKSSEFGQNGIPAIKIKNVRVGRVARHSAGLPTCLLNQRVGKVIVKQHTSCDLGFLFYALSQQETVRAIALKAHGAANQANVSPTQVESIEIPLPPLLVQRRIAGILSAYDELIENSQRRIRVLEAMARALYRGWFVHFLFSGHEKIPRVASPRGGIPRGWEATTLGTQLSALESGKRPKGGIRGVEDGVASIGAENINGIGRHDFDGEKFVPREFFEEMPQRRCL